MSYAVAERTREIGIRMALGARASDVLRLIVGRSVALALGGAGIGIIVALWAHPPRKRHGRELPAGTKGRATGSEHHAAERVSAAPPLTITAPSGRRSR
jgi:hypothetical protein